MYNRAGTGFDHADGHHRHATESRPPRLNEPVQTRGRGRLLVSDRYEIRPVVLSDADVLLEWRNDAETRRRARTQQVIDLADHVSWLAAALADESRLYRLLVSTDGSVELPLASVRYDCEAGTGLAVVSILVAPTARGRGIGRVALERTLPELRQWQPDLSAVLAVVHKDNPASRRLFQSTGFTYRDSDGPWQNYVLAL